MSSDRRLIREIERIAKRELGKRVEVKVDTDADAVFVGNARVQLGNIRRVWSQLGSKERVAWLAGALEPVLQDSPVPRQLDDTSALRVGLRSRVFVEATRLMELARGGKPNAIVHREFVPDLAEVLLWDLPTTMTALTEELIADWGVSHEELFAIGRRNVAGLPRLGFAAMDNRVFRLANGDDYDSSRLLADEVLAELPLTGDLAAFIPTRNTLIVTSADDADGIRIACDLARRDQQDTPVFKLPLVRRDGDWSLLELDSEHPAYGDWRALVAMEQSEAANSMQQILESMVGDHVYVASVMVGQNDTTGFAQTVSAWTDGVPTLLPRTDQVAFVSADGGSLIATAPWARVRETVPHLMEPTDHYPERWRVEGFPSPEEFARLRG